MGAESDLTKSERDRFHCEEPQRRGPKCPFIAQHVKLVIEDEMDCPDALWSELTVEELDEIVCRVTWQAVTWVKDRLNEEHKKLEG